MKREYASDSLPEERATSHGRKAPLYPQRATTAIEALMQCAPGREPEASVEELIHLRDIIQDAIDELPDRERWVFDEVVTRRTSLRALGLPKTTVARLRDKAILRLRTRLLQSQEILDYLGLDTDDY